MKYLKKFNELGIEAFRTELDLIRSGEKSNIDRKILSNEKFIETSFEEIKVKDKIYINKKDLINDIYALINLIPSSDKYYDEGLWTWLSAFFFDSVCPKDKKGIRKPGVNDRHILNSEHWGRYYRHLIAAPTRILEELGEKSEIYLAGVPNIHGDLFEQLASRQEIATNEGVISAATTLYWDKEENKIKRGARSKDGEGIIRRFAKDIIPQFQMTFDLNSMEGDEIIKLLPDEFNKWMN